MSQRFKGQIEQTEENQINTKIFSVMLFNELFLVEITNSIGGDHKTYNLNIRESREKVMGRFQRGKVKVNKCRTKFSVGHLD